MGEEANECEVLCVQSFVNTSTKWRRCVGHLFLYHKYITTQPFFSFSARLSETSVSSNRVYFNS